MKRKSPQKRLQSVSESLQLFVSIGFVTVMVCATIPDWICVVFYSDSKAEAACIGHLRIDFGKGCEFHSTWCLHKGETEGELNCEEFKETICLQIRCCTRCFPERMCGFAYIKKIFCRSHHLQ